VQRLEGSYEGFLNASEDVTSVADSRMLIEECQYPNLVWVPAEKGQGEGQHARMHS
jgi:hypothetical protein